MIVNELAVRSLRELSSRLGFAQLGIVGARDSPNFDRFCEWLDRGYSGSMRYLEDRREAYRHPDYVLENCKSIIMLAMPYAAHPRTQSSKRASLAQGNKAAATVGSGTIAAYAAGRRDYHDLIHERLSEIVTALNRMFPNTRSRGVVDTAPLLERGFAQLAGLGWIGKNTLLLNRELGSYFFLSAVLTQADLPATPAWDSDHCGTCRACLDACPTDAFVEPHVMNATRCISYWTIEHRGAIEESMREGIGDWLFGCDACQTVCPWNRKLELDLEPDLEPDAWSEKVDCMFWLQLDEATFRARFRHTPFWRTRLAGMQRNAMIVAANTRRNEAISVIRRFLGCGDAVLEETARWSLEQLTE